MDPHKKDRPDLPPKDTRAPYTPLKIETHPDAWAFDIRDKVRTVIRTSWYEREKEIKKSYESSEPIELSARDTRRAEEGLYTKLVESVEHAKQVLSIQIEIQEAQANGKIHQVEALQATLIDMLHVHETDPRKKEKIVSKKFKDAMVRGTAAVLTLMEKGYYKKNSLPQIKALYKALDPHNLIGGYKLREDEERYLDYYLNSLQKYSPNI